MVEICQTEDEIKIVIKLINIASHRPGIVLLKRYVKFNCPPTFFEAHLTDDIDEEKSTCKLFKREARIILKKVNKGLWEQIFEVPESKAAALEKRKAMVEQLQKKNVEIEEEAIKKYDIKKKAEIVREMKRESKLREKFEVANEQVLKNELGVTPEDTKKIKEREGRQRLKKQQCSKINAVSKPASSELENIEELENQSEIKLEKQKLRDDYCGPKIGKEEANVILQKIENQKQIRRNGSIKISFTKFDFKTPKRESQKEIQT
ncbi:uncharacterized protein LOC129612110, partial [Condylostylus longicornis]|uniref:uncharacterized protein LOC129612110 n=1 Tax=Condylostylus longicornis TaxID=2530218 RepID=UPI00244E31C8